MSSNYAVCVRVCVFMCACASLLLVRLSAASPERSEGKTLESYCEIWKGGKS